MDIPYGKWTPRQSSYPRPSASELKNALEEAPQLKAAINSDERLKI